MINSTNLQRLSTYLYYAEPPQGVAFDMWQFGEGGYSWAKIATNCGTIGCAVGWGPYAGIAKNVGEDFAEYAERQLINDDVEPDAWNWCFSHKWYSADNTRQGAAKRIQYLLDNGVPRGFENANNYRDYVHLYEDVVVKPPMDLERFLSQFRKVCAEVKHELAV